MAANYPTSLDTTTTLHDAATGQPILPEHHDDLVAAVIALEKKVGISVSDAANAGAGQMLIKQGGGGTAYQSIGSLSGINFGNAVTFGAGINVSGTVTATAFVGNGAGITGLAGATGGISNTGSTTIAADTDVNGVGIIDLQTRNISRMVIGNDGFIGIGTAAPTAIIDINTVPTPGAVQVVRIRTKEAGSGDYSWPAFFGTDFAGQVGRDNQIAWGYNVGGPGFVAGEHGFHWSIESRYKTSETVYQLEHYLTCQPGSGASGPAAIVQRPLSMNYTLADGVTWWAMRPNRLSIGSMVDPGYQWIDFNCDDEVMAFNGGAQLQYWGTQSNIIMANGVPLIGQTFGDVSLGRLFGGGIGNERCWLFPDASVGSGGGNTVSIGFGGASYALARKMRWNDDPAVMAFQYQAIDGTYRTFNDELGINQHHYAVTRAVGSTANDWTELGTIAQENKSGLFDVFVSTRDSTGAAIYHVTSKYASRNGVGWVEIMPTVQSNQGTDNVALDFNGTSGMLRLRRKGAGGSGVTWDVTIKQYSLSNLPTNGFTPSSATGAGGAVTGIYADSRVAQIDGALWLYDGAAMKQVSIGAADSAGTGFRFLRVPN